MTADTNDLVRVAAGSLAEVQFWHDLLREAGIESQVVGDNLAAGLGSALPESVELWVRRAAAVTAAAAIAGVECHHRREPKSHPSPPHAHPESDPKPDRSRGPQHGSPPHRPVPS